MDASSKKISPFDNQIDKDVLEATRENETLRQLVWQLQENSDNLRQNLSQSILECNTEKVSKRAVQRELENLRVLLKNTQDEQCLRWSQENRKQSTPLRGTSTNPFENERDEIELLGVYDFFILKFCSRNEKTLDELESVLSEAERQVECAIPWYLLLILS